MRGRIDLSDSKSLRIAICGTRGVPARYGGFETFAEQLGMRLVEKGHKVLVYGRYYKGELVEDLSEYKGMEICQKKAVRHKYFETPIHTFVSFLDLFSRRVDVVLLCNAANSVFSWMPQIKGIPVVINVDGIERARRKWNALGRLWYLIGEMTSALFGSVLISDANYIRRYYLDSYGADSQVIRYGARTLDGESARLKINDDYSFLSHSETTYLVELNLIPGSYLLYVSRLEPENNADKVIKAYACLDEELRSKYPLVIVGDAPYSDDFKRSIREIASPEVKFLGYRFGSEYETLQKGASIYYQATEVGGTHPALVEAMGYANTIIANDVPEHTEVVDGVAILYAKNDVKDLTLQTERLLRDHAQRSKLRKMAFDRALNEYSWDAICEKYIALFKSLK